MEETRSSEITPKSLYLKRREFLKGAGLAAAGSLLLAACRGQEGPSTSPSAGIPSPSPSPAIPPRSTSTPQPFGKADELGDPVTDRETAGSWANFYEFTPVKKAVAQLAEGFQTSPWHVQVGGLVRAPRTYDLDDLRRMFPPQERIYRLRCVEGWSMVIPWLGFPLASLLKEVEVLGDAKYVRMETIYDPEAMPGQGDGRFPWPYVEGLRLDEAMQDLTLLATGMYGEDLPPEHGAPLRLVVPWKYGFKSIKSIVKIDLVAEKPTSLWMAVVPQAYGFFANVNPEMAHPGWSQTNEQRLGETGRRDTLLFNGYAGQVSELYAGMDLQENY